MAFGQHASAFQDARDPDLELLSPAQHLAAALLKVTPGLQGLGQVRQLPVEMRLLGRDLGEALLGGEDRLARVVELGDQTRLLLRRACDVGALGLEGGTVAVGVALGRGAGVAGAGRGDARLGQVGLGQLGRAGGPVGPALRLFDRGLGDDARRRSGRASPWRRSGRPRG